MSPRQHQDLGASVRARLLNLAKAQREPFDLVLVRFGLERLLYRLSRSRWRRSFVLKGAQLFALWMQAPHRPTRDLDLLGYGPCDVESVTGIFRELCSMQVEDALLLRAESVTGAEIRERNAYHGVRVRLVAQLAGALIPLQVDVGFGDAVVPEPTEVSVPPLLDPPGPRLLAYSRYTVVAEKLQAMLVLGMANSRMKDYYDLWQMAERLEFDGALLAQALQATFARRGTALRCEMPLALSESFAEDPQNNTQWLAFLRRNRLEPQAKLLADVLALLRMFVMPPLQAAARGQPFVARWPAAGPWCEPR